MLEVIVNMKNLFDCYVYYTNPVNFIFMCCVTIFWTKNIRSVFDTVTGSMHEMKC